MKIIFGLGNPGPRYEATRHNCGFIVLDHIADTLGCSFGKKEQDNEIASGFYKGEKLLLAKPQSFMNLSGYPLARLCSYYKVDYEDILVVHDDLDLPPGALRLRRGGSAGGHNGLKSIIEQTGITAINRLKIGIGSPRGSVIDYVISPFYEDELPILGPAFIQGAEAALCWASQGITAAMNLYNRSAKKEAPAEDQPLPAEGEEQKPS